MYRFLSIVLTVVVLFGCSQQNDQMDKVLILRNSIVNSNGCAFDVTITADYLDSYHTFGMRCISDEIGNVTFEIIEPNSISGITGIVTSEDGKLTFDDQVLLFPTIAEDLLTPVSAPWFFLKSLKSGYIRGCGMDSGLTLLQIDDSYSDNVIKMNVQIIDGVPIFAEIIWQDRCIVTMEVREFHIL